jgi:hypothetical protein
MNRIFQTILAASLLLVAVPSVDASPQSPQGTITFDTVDSVQFIPTAAWIDVTGVVNGQAQADEYRFYFHDMAGAAECHKQAMIAMDHPGRYRLFLGYNPDAYGAACRLTRR